MLDRVLILNANQWSMKDDQTGELREGTAVHYVSSDYLDNGSSRGPSVFKETAPSDFFHDLQALPGIYDVKFTASTVRDSRGNVKRGMKPNKATFVDSFELDELLQGETVS